TLMVLPSMVMEAAVEVISFFRLPRMESYLSRWASVAGLVRSLTATISISGLPSDARNTLRPMRPKPLIPTFTAIEASLLRLVYRNFCWPFEGARPRSAQRLQPPCSHASTVVNKFLLRDGKLALVNTFNCLSPPYVLHPIYARMDARKNETTFQAWPQQLRGHRKDRPGNPR